MAVAALKQKPALKTFHSTVYVTRMEQWCVEASEIGDCINIEVEQVEE
jgi:hypothetical protein